MEGYIELGADNAEQLIEMVLEDYILDGDRTGLDLIRSLVDDHGIPIPIDDFIAEVLIAEGRLICAPATDKGPLTNDPNEGRPA